MNKIYFFSFLFKANGAVVLQNVEIVKDNIKGKQ